MHNILWLGLEAIFTDIPWQKTNITQLVIGNIQFLIQFQISSTDLINETPEK